MKDSRALPSRGGLIGIILTVVAVILLGVAIWLTWQSATATTVQPAIQAPDGGSTDDSTPDLVYVSTGTNLGTFGLGLVCFGLLLVVLYLAYQTRRFFALRYTLDRNAITIDLGDRKQTIPLANIRHLVPATSVLNQMRERVYGPKSGNTPSTGTSAKAYPRATPAVVPEPTTTLVETEPVRAETEDPTETQDQKAANGPSYSYTQAAADGSIEKLEPVEVLPAETQVETQVEEIAARPVEDITYTEVEDLQDVEEGQITELKPSDVRNLAVDFDDDDDDEKWVSTPAVTARNNGNGTHPNGATNSNNTTSGPTSGPTGAADAASAFTNNSKDGSVNFQVKAPLLSSWPGFYLNQASVASLGPVQFYSTQPLEKTLLVRTDKQTYAISPAEPQQFVTEFNLRRRLGAIESVEEKVLPGAFLSHPLWHDRIGRGLIFAGVILNLVIYLYLIVRYDGLKDSLRIHFDKFGEVDQIGGKDDLMFLPFVGLLGVVANSILGAFVQTKDRIPAYLLYGAGILLQVMTAIAILVILAVSGS